MEITFLSHMSNCFNHFSQVHAMLKSACCRGNKIGGAADMSPLLPPSISSSSPSLFSIHFSLWIYSGQMNQLRQEHWFVWAMLCWTGGKKKKKKAMLVFRFLQTKGRNPESQPGFYAVETPTQVCTLPFHWIHSWLVRSLPAPSPALPLMTLN